MKFKKYLSKNPIVLVALLMAVLFSTTLSQAQDRGEKGGNGGNALHCRRSNVNSLVGCYAQDFVLTYRPEDGDSDLVPVSSWEQSHERIIALLKEKLPALVDSF